MAEATETKRPAEGAPQGLTANAGPDASSPAMAKDDSTDSPSAGRGARGGRGGGRGARGGRGDGRGGRGGRGGDSRGRGRGGSRSESDSRTWGGRSDNAPDGKKRSWGPQVGPDGLPLADEEKKERFPKKKVAVLIGYNGGAYKGSQINPGVETIEGEVFKAFVSAGAVSEDNSSSYQKVGLTRAARTDAGVHATINVLSLKLILTPPTLPADTTIEAHINSFLPPTIRVWSIIQVQGSFNPRQLCDQRQYQYTLPTHVFLGPKPGSAMASWVTKARAQASTSPATAEPPVEGAEVDAFVAEAAKVKEATAAAAKQASDASDEFWAAQPEGTTFLADVAAKREWRISPVLLANVRDYFKEYEGSHNYYNYTVGKDFRDRSCQRVMRKLEVSDPFLVNGTEYVSVMFLGQSFMLHQIRKMIGLAILAIRTQTPPSLVPETFGPSHIHVPKAPALGLLLLEPQYNEYNKRVNEANAKLVILKDLGRISDKDQAEQTREHMDYAKLADQLEAFKQESVYKKMWEIEEADAVFSRWLNWLDVYIGPDFEYLNPNGTIPAVATFKKGENPEQFKIRTQPVPDAAEEILPLSDDEGVAPGQEDG